MTSKVNKGTKDSARNDVRLKGGPLDGVTVKLSQGTGTLEITLKGQRGSYNSSGVWVPA